MVNNEYLETEDQIISKEIPELIKTNVGETIKYNGSEYIVIFKTDKTESNNIEETDKNYIIHTKYVVTLGDKETWNKILERRNKRACK